MVKLLVTIFALFISAPLSAQQGQRLIFWSGNDLYYSCGKSAPLDQYAACHAYIRAVSDSNEVNRVDLGLPQCLPDRINSGQLVDVVRAYLEAHPAIRHRPAATLAQWAIYEAFCPNQD